MSRPSSSPSSSSRSSFALALGLALGLLDAPLPAQRPPVLCGIDVLEHESFQRLDRARVGLITNHAGRNRIGERTIDVLRRARNVELVALFSPEHGLGGTAEGEVADSTDGRTGLRVHSLYGETRELDDAALENVNCLVCDLPDVGCRYYTYASTMLAGLRAAFRRQIRFVVLDRPNPLGGTLVAGPVLDAGREGFTGVHTLPIVHGMTMAELAHMLNKELGIEADLRPILMHNWKRDMPLDRAGVPWVDPSPNIRSLTHALLYPGTGLLESTNVSVGRGTEHPFELLGAPWLEGTRLAARLEAAAVPGAAFVPRRFTPSASVFAGEACDGVQILITDRAAFDPVALGMNLACALRDLFPQKWTMDGVDRLLCSAKVLEALRAGKTPAELAALWKDDLAAFGKRRERYLLYK